MPWPAQTCHIPEVHFWAYRSDSWGLLGDAGTSRIALRGIEGDIVDPESKVTGFHPAYISTPAKDGHLEIRPTNLIAGTCWWDETKGRPVFTWQVQRAFFDHWSEEEGWVYREEIVRAFGDAEGIVDPATARYDTPEKIALVRGLLQKYGGISDPELRVEVVPWAMSHSTVPKEQAVKECTACHAKKSLLHNPLDLDDHLPRGVPVVFMGKERPVADLSGKVPVFDNRSLLSSFYIIGNSRVLWIEWIGWLSVAGALLFALGHGALRLVLGGRP